MQEVITRVYADLKMKRFAVGTDPANTFRLADTLSTMIGKSEGDDEADEGEATREATAKTNRDEDGSSSHSVKQRRGDDSDDEEPDAAKEESDDEDTDNKEEAPKQFETDLLESHEFDTSKLQITFTLSVDADKPKLLLVEMIDKMCQSFVIRAIPGIRRAAVLKPDKNDPTVRQCPSLCRN